MKLQKPYTLEEISKIINCNFIGKPDHQITGINEIHSVQKGDLIFVDHPKYYEKAIQSNANTILINKEIEFPEDKQLLFLKSLLMITTN